MSKTIRILGTRGIPASHGGFETFAEYLSLYLVKNGWRVIVYCQLDGQGPIYEDVWEGVERVNIPIAQAGAKGTVIFDWVATKHASQYKDLSLTLGYNTAFFCALLRIKNIPNVINMDGIEWKRQKWGIVAKTWFYLNEIAGLWLGNHLVADHPGIKQHLQRAINPDKITMIPYGADKVERAPSDCLEKFHLVTNQYGILIARPEPENSILEVVSAYSSQKRSMPLVVLGNYKPEENVYHKAVLDAASGDVLFVGAIYDKAVVQSLRAHARFYVHGHQVGGTNPSLVEALGAGNPVLAHKNHFNQWVADDAAVYFSDTEECISCLEQLLSNDSLIEELHQNAVKLHQSRFTWHKILSEYEALLMKWLPNNS
jgi:glycosyltransferase involved in cell wall biosynthesis